MAEKKYLGCRIDSDVLSDVKEIAKKEHRSVSNMVEVFLRQGVGHPQHESRAA